MAFSGSTVSLGNLDGARDAFAAEQLSVTTAAVVTLTVATYNPSTKVDDGTSVNQPANAALITQQTATNTVNFTMDGTTPTTGATGIGHTLLTNDNVVVFGLQNLKNFKMIATTGTCSVFITYFR